jgi:alkanesulfonate monooxygenase SsuD/methylene tetrahydromethanopterin reductase-like flavin-dependent oxidoreductase (luciferase family)
VTYAGTYYQLSELAGLPRPVQRPHPPVWIGANADKAVRRSAALGDAWLINTHSRLGTLARQMHELYRPALEEQGKPFPEDLPIRREIFVAEDRETARREAAPWLLAKFRTYTQWGQDRVLPDDDEFHEEAEELFRDRFILGSPEQCIAEIDRYRELLGATEFIVRVQWPGMPNEIALANIKRIGSTLIPHYRTPGA